MQGCEYSDIALITLTYLLHNNKTRETQSEWQSGWVRESGCESKNKERTQQNLRKWAAHWN